MPIDPLLRAWGNPLPAIIRDMRTTATAVGITDLLKDAVSALDTQDGPACRAALVSVLALLGHHTPHPPDMILAAMVESVTVID